MTYSAFIPPSSIMSRKIKFGLVQLHSVSPALAPDAPAHNLAHALDLVREAAADGAQVVVLPEFFLTTGKHS